MTVQYLPKSAILVNIGKVRVISYEGDGQWIVLDPNDQYRKVSTSRLIFLKR